MLHQCIYTIAKDLAQRSHNAYVKDLTLHT